MRDESTARCSSDDRICDKSDCPGISTLRAYVLGDLEECKIEHVSETAVRCARCQETLDCLDGETDSVICRLRQAGRTAPAPDSTDLQDLIYRASERRRMRTDESPHTSDYGKDERTEPCQLGQYRILNRLGAGGMGVVYLAEHLRLQRMVAVKIVTPLGRAEGQADRRFEREMKAIGKLQHPNIVRATDAGEDQGRTYLVMEFVDGVDIETLLDARGPFPIADACEVVRQAAIGLHHAHGQEIIHRDVKPSNLMLSMDGQIKVLDLGLARLLAEEHSDSLTESGQLLGTLDYVAPEQVTPAATVDARTDIYGLGCTLYALLTGHPPFHGSAYQEPLRKIAAHARHTPPPIEDGRADVPPGLVEVVNRTLEKEPSARFATASELAAAIEPFSMGADLQRLHDTPQFGADVVMAGTTRIYNELHDERSNSHPRTWLIGVFIAGMLALSAFCWGMAVVRFVTDRGTLVVEFASDAFEPEFDGKKLTLREQGTERVYSIDLKSRGGTTDLPAGSYLVVADNQGMTAAPEVFSISRNGETIVRVSLSASAPASEAANRTTQSTANLVQPKQRIEWDDDGLISENPGFHRREVVNGRYRLWHVKGTNGSWAWGQHAVDQECIIEVVGRVDEGFGGAWVVNLSNRSSKAGARVSVHDGWLSIRPSMFGRGKHTEPLVRVLRHRAINAGHELNRLHIIVRRKSLELYMNGERIYGPFTFAADWIPASLALGIMGGGQQDARVELERIVIWPTTDINRIPDIDEDTK